MRLDHLLSKEHLKSSDFQNPVRRHTFFAGSSWVEHLTRLSCECLVSSTTFGFGTELGSWVRACTLLGPEGPGVTPLGVAAVPLGLLLLLVQWGLVPPVL